MAWCPCPRARKRYGSYKGELTKAPKNLVDRDFHAERPNMLWVTDLTEFSILAGKAYLSPVIDCYDGLPVAWTIGTSPDSALANGMLADACSMLKEFFHKRSFAGVSVDGFIGMLDEYMVR